jgi:outer membrane protein assembly factor BamB
MPNLFRLRSLAVCAGFALLAGCGGSGGSSIATTPSLAQQQPDPGAATTPSLAAGDDWNTFGHDQERSGHETLPIGVTPSNVSKLKLRWYFKSASHFVGSPIVVAGVVYVVDGTGLLTALDAQTGKKIWQNQLPATVAMTPSIYDGVLYIATHITSGKLYAIDPKTGSILWSQSLAGSGRAVPAYVNGKLYIGVAAGDPPTCKPGGIYEFDAKTGAPGPKWLTDPGSQTLGGAVWGPISYDGTRLVFGTGNTCDTTSANGNSIAAVDPATLTSPWHFQTAQPQTDNDVAGGVMIHDGVGYVIGKVGTFYAVKVATGQVLWSKALGAPVLDGGYATPAIAGSTVIISPGALSSREAAPPAEPPGGALDGLSTSGTLEWRIATRWPVVNAVATTSDLVFAHLDNTVSALDPATGKRLWTYVTQGYFSAAPAIGPSGIFAADIAGYVYAFGIPSSSGSAAAIHQAALPHVWEGMPSKYVYQLPASCRGFAGGGQ